MFNLDFNQTYIQDRDGGLLVLQAMCKMFSFIERIFANGGH